MTSSPHYSKSYHKSISRSSSARHDVQRLADQMLRQSLEGPSTHLSLDFAESSVKRSDVELDPSASSPGTMTPASSHTRERLRHAERERDELRKAMFKERANASQMRRLAEEQQAVADRLKREGTTTGISVAEAKARMLELERGARMARAQKRVPSSGAFKAACSTDLLFLMDTTASMYGHIDAAKRQVISIVDDIKDAFMHSADIRIAAVSYKDHGDTGHCASLDFTTSADEVHTFIASLKASGGGYDLAEDVLGGLSTSLGLSWLQQTRCIIHIADNPAHGNIHTSILDNYPHAGSEPHGLTYQPLLQRIIAKGINYAFLRITHETDLMVYNFIKEYAAANADASLHESNKYYTEAYRSLAPNTRLSQDTIKAGLYFAELQIGTTYSALRRLVVSTVTSSASRTATRMSATRSARSNIGSSLPIISPRLPAYLEEEPEITVPLDSSTPEWDTSGWLDEHLVVEGFLPSTVSHSASTLNDMMASDDSITMSVSELSISKRSQPFAQGSLRVAYYARTQASTNRFVVKAFKRSKKQIHHLVEDMRCQALCKAFALEFNALTDEEEALDFIATTCFKGKSAWAGGPEDECLSLEPFVPGTYVKYNTNFSWVNTELGDDRLNQLAQAFSHFTFERSRGRFLVCDLQGVGHILTDPSIHTLDPERFKLVDTNMGPDGFKFFFSTHVCNDICQKLELKSEKSMLRPGGTLTFRPTWPLLYTKTICCYNRLCGKIMHVFTARRSDVYPGYYWCNTCWPQLRTFEKRWLCVVGDGDHEYDVSTFFYESQGRRAPRRCPDHAEEEETITDRGRVYRIRKDSSIQHTPLPAPEQTSVTEPKERDIGSRAYPLESLPELPAEEPIQYPSPYSYSPFSAVEPSSSSYATAPIAASSIPPSYATRALGLTAYDAFDESTTTLTLSQPCVGTYATPRNSKRLWKKLKSATKRR